MQKRSLADAKAHLSELVDAAEHHGKKIVILRHGKPAAAIVPLQAIAPKRRRRRTLSEGEARRSVDAFVAEFSAAQPEVSAVEELLQGRK